MTVEITPEKIAEVRAYLLQEFEWMTPAEAAAKADEIVAFLFPGRRAGA